MPRHAPAPCLHCSGQTLPHHRPRTAAMTFRFMPLCARPPCHLHRTTCREMCAADADEVCLPRPKRDPLFFRYPPALLPCWIDALRPSCPAVLLLSLHMAGAELPLSGRHCPASPCPPSCPPARRAPLLDVLPFLPVSLAACPFCRSRSPPCLPNCPPARHHFPEVPTPSPRPLGTQKIHSAPRQPLQIKAFLLIAH